MSLQTVTQAAGILSVDILRNDFHRPLVDGRANRDNIEDAITVGMLSGALKYHITQEVVDLAIDLVDDLLKQYGVSK